MPSYKINVLVRHPDEDQEEAFEQGLQAALYELGVVGITGIVAHQVWPYE